MLVICFPVYGLRISDIVGPKWKRMSLSTANTVYGWRAEDPKEPICLPPPIRGVEVEAL